MRVSEDVLRIWMADAKKYLHRYWDHPCYDDIVAEAYLTMWEALVNADEGQVRDVKAYAVRAAWYGAQAFIGGPRNPSRTWNIFHRTSVTPDLSLEGVRAGHYEEWTPRHLVEPDFAPALVERLAADQELERLNPAKRAALILCCVHGLTREEARLQLGFSRSKIDKLLARVPFAAIPYAHPGPGAPKNWHLRQRDARGCFR